MGAAFRSANGLGAAGVAALSAGVDLILISYDPDQVFPVLHALLRAERSGALTSDALEVSAGRLAQVTAELAGGPKAAASAR